MTTEISVMYGSEKGKFKKVLNYHMHNRFLDLNVRFKSTNLSIVFISSDINLQALDAVCTPQSTTYVPMVTCTI